MISIIIPVYNAERTLRRCVDSVIAQTYQDWECILVDDGSKDSSPAICDEYAAKDSRIRVIHKENGGVSSARNCGLDVYTGSYVTFIDSDDYIKPDYLNVLIDGGVGYDMTCVGAQYFGKSSSVIAFASQQAYKVREDDLRPILCTYLFSTPWGKLYKSDIVRKHNVRFPEGIRVAEDSCFVWNYLRYCDCLLTLPVVAYMYQTDNNHRRYYMDFDEYEHHLTYLKGEALKLSEVAVATNMQHKLDDEDYFFFSMFRGYLWERSHFGEFVEQIRRYRRKYGTPPTYPREPRGIRLCTWLAFRLPCAGWIAWRFYAFAKVKCAQ